MGSRFDLRISTRKWVLFVLANYIGLILAYVPLLSLQPLKSTPSYIVLGNLQSGGNIGRIIRSAAIFGVRECIVVGQRKWPIIGDHGSRFDLPQRHFYDHESARAYLADECGARIIGVEILDGASPLAALDAETGTLKVPWIASHSFDAVAYVFGNGIVCACLVSSRIYIPMPNKFLILARFVAGRYLICRGVWIIFKLSSHM